MEALSSFLVWCETKSLGAVAASGPTYGLRNGMRSFKLRQLLVYGLNIWKWR